MQNISDLKFQEFGNNKASNDELDLNEDYSCKTVRVKGQRSFRMSDGAKAMTKAGEEEVCIW